MGNYRVLPNYGGVACAVHGSYQKPGAKIPPPPLDLAKVRKQLASPANMTRKQAYIDLRRGEGPEVLALLEAGLADAVPLNRKQAAWSLGVVAHGMGRGLDAARRDRILAALRGLEADANARVRDFALYARARLGEVEARRAIPALLADEGRSELRRQHGREALADGGGPV